MAKKMQGISILNSFSIWRISISCSWRISIKSKQKSYWSSKSKRYWSSKLKMSLGYWSSAFFGHFAECSFFQQAGREGSEQKNFLPIVPNFKLGHLGWPRYPTFYTPFTQIYKISIKDLKLLWPDGGHPAFKRVFFYFSIITISTFGDFVHENALRYDFITTNLSIVNWVPHSGILLYLHHRDSKIFLSLILG